MSFCGFPNLAKILCVLRDLFPSYRHNEAISKYQVADAVEKSEDRRMNRYIYNRRQECCLGNTAYSNPYDKLLTL